MLFQTSLGIDIEDSRVSMAYLKASFKGVGLAAYAIHLFEKEKPVEEKLGTVRGLVEDFLRFHEDASNFIRDEPGRAARLVAEMVEVVDEDFIREVYQISPRYCAALPREYIESAMAFVPVLRKLGYIEQELEEDDIFDTSLIEAFHSGKQHYLL